MNCEQIKQQVSIRTVLESYGLFPVKENRRTAFYFALDREEKTASLAVDFIKNTAFDFGTGKSYDIISIVQAKNRCNVSNALEYLKKFDFTDQNIDIAENTQKSDYNILKIIEIKHPALIQYLKSRKVLGSINFVKEVHYKINGKTHFGLGFLNRSGGIEVRSKYSKICLGPKDVSWIKNENKLRTEIAIFEGFFDFLSYKTLEDTTSSAIDYLILNSTAMLFAAHEIIVKYEKKSLFLDNDATGNALAEKLCNTYDNVEDCSYLYQDFKDFNQWLTKYL